MPKIVERLVSQLTANGMDKKKAYAVAVSRMKKAGNLDSSGKETEKGKKRGDMTPAQRAKDRAAKERGGKPSDYKYNSKNNSAVKGKVNKAVKARK
jgi:DNA-binding transcriptional regulator PaaX